ncbi:hypothetical protein BG74_00280 [Sodalis-like endosymbiont of Proechinophthirus fluctus]|nr:hypothetical protein BG74_00280 [Sodalis-like endosymbiont of Proechinophthirus fluctus]
MRRRGWGRGKHVPINISRIQPNPPNLRYGESGLLKLAANKIGGGKGSEITCVGAANLAMAANSVSRHISRFFSGTAPSRN